SRGRKQNRWMQTGSQAQARSPRKNTVPSKEGQHMAQETDLYPCDTDIERWVLGAVLRDGDFFAIAGVLTVNDFSLEKHRKILRRATEVHERGEYVDRITVSTELRKHGELEACDGLSYLVEMDVGLPAYPNLDEWCRILREYRIMRETIELCYTLPKQLALG